MLRTFRLVLTLAALLLGLVPAQAAKRVALVIGNDRYAALPQLRNAVADARLVAQVLKNDLQFQVFAGENLDYRATNRLHADFEAAIAPGDTAFVFFAGHGVAFGAENYLLPTDVEKPRAGEENLVRSEAHAVDALVRRVQARGAVASFFVIDACRDNPFDAVGVRSIGNSRGLARADVPTGVFVLFSAGIGQTALDRLNAADRVPNSVFTRTLVPLLRQPGLTHLLLAKQVQTQVRALAASVSHQQQPAFYDQIDGEVVFKVAVPGASPAPAPAVAAPPPPAGLQTAVVAPPASAPASPPAVTPAVGIFPEARGVYPLTAEKERALKPKDTFKECDKCPEMVVVPAGRFTMGSPDNENGRDEDEGPQHVVTIARPFAAGKFHVTVEQFAAFVAENSYDAGSKCLTFENGEVEERQGRSWRNPGFAQAGTHPAVCLSWNDVKAYVDWIARKTGRAYRLLTEAEWEYAARARTEPGAYPRYWFGNEEKDLCRHGNGADQEAKSKIAGTTNWTFVRCNDGYAYTAPVGSFAANGFGLHDMAGNAWQWTADCWNASYTGAPSNGSAWTTGECNRRVVRGGSWNYDPGYLRAAGRGRDTSDFRYDDFGFRLGRTLTP